MKKKDIYQGYILHIYKINNFKVKQSTFLDFLCEYKQKKILYKHYKNFIFTKL